MSRVVDTATAVLAVLAEHDPDPVLSADMRSGVTTYGGYPNYIPEAVRHLRRQGTMVAATKARHLSTYRLLGDVSGEDAHRRASARRLSPR